MNLANLTTARGRALSGMPWNAHPKPQLRRERYRLLNGIWDFSAGEEGASRPILVPFCPEAPLSGIGEHFPEGTALRYRRSISLPENWTGGHVLLHIGAADQHAKIYVNQVQIGEHHGGYESFCFDITDSLQPGENRLEIVCTDDLRDLSQPYGKQVLPQKRGGMWYTPVSGIWQSVWLEWVPENYVNHISIDVTGEAAVITVEPALNGTVRLDTGEEFPLAEGVARVTPKEPQLWSPESPYLYDFTLTAGEDVIRSYFALRTLETKLFHGIPRLCLNGKPYFFHGLLDQGYWPDGLLTPAAPACYADDIHAMKRLGFNTLRKHIKIEPEEFYYQCDRLGMVVFQDMVNNGYYSFLRDTGLPSAIPGSQTWSDKFLRPNKQTKKRFLEGMTAAVSQLKNHPCICYWTVFNEGWGQFEADKGYEALKALDDTRFIDATSGWFRQKKTDVDSLHVYFRKVELTAGDKPLVVSEFGGYAYKVEGHSFNPEKEYGYGSYSDGESFGKAVAALYLEQIVPCIRRGLCAAIYTQVSDVEDGVNGLRTYDRRVEKLTPGQMLPVAKALREAIIEE